MKFPVLFSRFVGGAGGQPVLGDGSATGDLVPNGGPSNGKAPNVGATNTNSKTTGPGDNCLNCARMNLVGWPPQRIAVVCKYIGAGTPADIPCTVYFYDQATGAWYKLNAAAINVKPTIVTADSAAPSQVGVIAYFDIPAMMDLQPTGSNLQNGNTIGAIFVLIQPVAPAAAPNGEYRFGVAADLSSSP